MYSYLKLLYEKIVVCMRIFTLLFCVLTLPAILAFVFGYMRNNSFFDWSIFSISSIWLFIMATIVAIVICALLYAPIIILTYIKLYNPDDSLSWKLVLYISYMISLFFIIMLILSSCIGFIAWELTSFYIIASFFIGFIFKGVVYLSFFRETTILFRIRKRLLYIVLLIVIYLTTLLIFPNIFSKGIEKFLISNGIASYNAEIYLRNYNKTIHGRLIFDNSNISFVEYKDIAIDCNKTIKAECEKKYFRQKVPSVDVRIIPEINNKIEEFGLIK